jgi:hypothetical protein
MCEPSGEPIPRKLLSMLGRGGFRFLQFRGESLPTSLAPVAFQFSFLLFSVQKGMFHAVAVLKKRAIVVGWSWNR